MEFKTQCSMRKQKKTLYLKNSFKTNNKSKTYRPNIQYCIQYNVYETIQHSELYTLYFVFRIN